MPKFKRPAAARKASLIDWRKSLGLHPDFPLCRHPAGYWCKKVKGKLHYFAKIADDPKGEAAMLEWTRIKDDLLAGRKPRAKVDGVTIAELGNQFLNSKDRQLAAGELSARSRLDYQTTCDRIVAKFSKERVVVDLQADDFEELRATLAKTLGPVALGNEIQRVRTIFKYGYEAGLLEHPVRFGPAFCKPNRRTMRLALANKGPKLFAAADVKKLLKSADVQMKAMILLGVNCGFGNSDCGTLPIAALDLGNGWIDYRRGKTGIPRRCPLWAETVAALKVVLKRRKQPKNPADEDLVFVTKYGGSWGKQIADNPVSKAFRKLLDDAGLYKPGLGFYALRHTFRTIADAAKDQPAANSIMGHADLSMAGVYRELIDDDRLEAVTTHVHIWLYGKGAGKKTTQPAKRKAPASGAKKHAQVK